MDALKVAVAVAALLAAAPTRAESVADWRAYVVEASARFGVPIAWIERVMQTESAGRTTLDGRQITSRAGAMGLMQLMPATWLQLHAACGLGSNPYDPHDNILAGTAYLRAMYDRFGYPGLFAAYNAGPGRYAEYLAGTATLPSETTAYLARVSEGGGRSLPGRAAISDPLFAVQRDQAGIVSVTPTPTPSAEPTGLFAIVRQR